MNDHIVRAYPTVEIGEHGERLVLIIETDLPLMKTLPGYDEFKFSELVSASKRMMAAGLYSSARLTGIRYA